MGEDNGGNKCKEAGWVDAWSKGSFFGCHKSRHFKAYNGVGWEYNSLNWPTDNMKWGSLDSVCLHLFSWTSVDDEVYIKRLWKITFRFNWIELNHINIKVKLFSTVTMRNWLPIQISPLLFVFSNNSLFAMHETGIISFLDIGDPLFAHLST